MSIGQRIREARKRRKLTLLDIASACGKSQQAVSAWERGQYEPGAADIATIAQLTHSDANWIISGKETPASTGAETNSWLGRAVASVPWGLLSGYLAGGEVAAEQARSHFPCGPRSFQTIVEDRSNAPDIEPGHSVVVDPDEPPQPGDYVLVRIQKSFAIRKYRPRPDHIELAPANADWPTLVVQWDNGAILVGTVTEITRPRIK